MQSNTVVPRSVEVGFILITADGVVGVNSYGLVDGQTTEPSFCWVTEPSSETESVILTTSARNDAGVVTDSKFTISGDDWRFLESNGFVEELATRLLALEDSEDVCAEMMER